jgi:hypothetical protein
MIRRLPSGEYRLYSRKKNPKTGKRRNLGTFRTRAEALQHERANGIEAHLVGPPISLAQSASSDLGRAG